MTQDAELTVWEHLSELRSRLMKAGIAFIVATLVSMVFTPQFLEILTDFLPNMPQVIKPTETFIVYFKIAMIGGAALSMPIILYQIIRFILPGLMPNEKRYLYMFLPGVGLCFIGGVAFASLVMLPTAIQFLQGFLDQLVENNWTLESYISFVTRVMFWMGVVFQTPLLIFLLAKLGLVSPRSLARNRKYAVLVCAVIAALVTPTPDPVNMMIVMVPLYFLFEIGIVLARLAVVGRKDQEGSPRIRS